ncbi:hypothetical protein GCM10023201_06710 [Actinomycetospora corticicola]|uniref:Capsular polysaccharide biosynthesis protein n=1 Tax=Actinomycetospora corticicola TaxID=663602 RepID=A0A7Y9DSN1_9PSEU|nr:hypothetical protein [Actinomycetospora corticicola]NYD34680.1 hypothetical protein [Actinomycetospora corticicola]
MGVRGGVVVLATTLLGLVSAAVVVQVTPPLRGVALDRPVLLAAGARPPADPGPEVLADAAALLGGTPTAAELDGTATVDLADGVLAVRARAATAEEAAVVARALATAAARRITQAADDGRPANRPAVVIGEAEPRDTGPDPHPGAVLAAGALLGLLPGLVALRRVPDVGPGRLPRSRRDPVVLTPGTGRRHARRVAAVRDVAESVRDGRVIAVVESVERSGVSAAVEIATALAHVGARVLLVEAGSRSPTSRVRRVADPSPGVREVIAGVAETDRAIRPWARGGIDVLPTGRSGPPLADDDVAAVLAPLGGRYDHVVLDAPGPADLVVAVRGTRVTVQAPGRERSGSSESRRRG